MVLELARRLGRAKGYASGRWALLREQWRQRLQLARRVGLIWVAVTLLLAAIKLWRQW